MIDIRSLFHKVCIAINRRRFDRKLQGILDTNPIHLGNTPLTLLSMVHHRDVLSYLLAAKSFARFIVPAKVVIVADPSITPADRELLKRHIPEVCFRNAAEFHCQELPKGGTWERLTAIAEYAQERFVIQLDADTVATKAMPEVELAIRENHAFLLGTEDVQQIQPVVQIATWAKGRLAGDDHVQLVAESVLDGLSDQSRWKYVRACSGFAGFPRGAFGKEQLVRISQEMSALLGERWKEWGTEQFTSNLVLASMEGAKLLPHPKYCAPHRANGDTAFRHFIGYVRHTTPLYAILAGQVAAELRSGG
ncbi:MAG: hypothetical protein FD131_218 [Rhodocyclaceae bacterium]|nr:MAG: hypothetical protein FD131_218 [Rhodocyclaceae bacterium]